MLLRFATLSRGLPHALLNVLLPALLAPLLVALPCSAVQAQDGIQTVPADERAHPLAMAGDSADVYVEARLRPRYQGTAAGQAYVLGRYHDQNNWYGAGLSFNPVNKRMQIEIVLMHDGVLKYLKQFKRAAVFDQRWYAVRLDMAGGLLTAYLNGEKITSVSDNTLRKGGATGLYAGGLAFDASTPVSGKAGPAPARIALARMPQRVHLQNGDAPLHLPVSAVAPGGMGGLRFTAAGSDPGMVRVAADDGGVTLSALAAGVSTLTLTSVDDPNVFTVIDVIAGARAPAREAAYKLSGAVTPAPGERDVPDDTPLRLRFDQPPALAAGTAEGATARAGVIRVMRKRDNAVVDTIRGADEDDLLGYDGQELRRAVRRQPIAIEGRDAIIHLHGARLQPGEEYYVTIDDGVFSGVLQGQAFSGVTQQQGWSFRTRAAPPPRARLTVDDDGPADFRTVQGALNHVMRMQGGDRHDTAPVTIEIRNGRYQELLYLHGGSRITLRGESRDGVVIDALNSDGVNPGSGASQAPSSPGANGGRALFMIEDTDLLTIESLTVRNSTLRAAPAGGQAEAIYFNSEGRLIVKNVSLFSEQDTVQVKGYAWFYRTLIAGNVDYVWGNNHAALFEDSELRTVGDSGNWRSGGYLVQARTVAQSDKGFVFLNSRLTRGAGPNGSEVPDGATYLARSPGYADTWDHVAFINCRMDKHVLPAGWFGKPAPNPLAAAKDGKGGWVEYGSMDIDGKPLDLGAREHGRVLGAAQAQAQYGSRAAVFAAYGNGRGWQPTPERAE